MDNLKQKTNLFENEISFPVNLEVLRKYHPLYKIEYDYAILNQEDLTYTATFKILTHGQADQNEADKHFSDLQKVFDSLQSQKKPLSKTDIGNILSILFLYFKLESSDQVKELVSITKEFKNIIKNLFLIEENELKPTDIYMQFYHGKTNKEWFKNKIQTIDKDIVLNMLNHLKQIYFEKLYKLQETYLATTNLLFWNPIEEQIALAIRISINEPAQNDDLFTFNELYKKITEFDGKVRNVINPVDDGKRMLFSKLLQYLNSETSVKPDGNYDGKPKKTSNLQYQVIYHLCSMFNIVAYSDDKTKQKDLIRGIEKNLSADHSFKLESIKNGTG